MICRRLIIALSLLVMGTDVFAGGPGTTNANFLKLGQGVRPIAMGETYIALGNGLDTLYWNPAGLVQIQSAEACFIHNFWFQEIGTEYLSFGTPLGPLGAVGGGVTVMHAGTIEKTVEDEFGNYDGTQGEASAMSIALIGTYSQKLSRIMPAETPFLRNVLVGASLRLITENVAETNVFGGGLDIGAIWRQTEEIQSQDIATASGSAKGSGAQPAVRDNGWRLGLVAQNLGVTTDQLMPINFRAGLGYVAQELLTPNGRGTLALDALIPIDNDIKLSFGGEYALVGPQTLIAGRVGYKIGNEIKDLDSMAGLTAGLGVAIQLGAIRYQIDYAFVPYGELGTTHRLSFTLGFLGEENIVRPPAQPKVVPPEKAIVPPTALAKREDQKAETLAKPKPAVEPVPAAAIPLAQPVALPAPRVATSQDKDAQIAQLEKSLQRFLGRVKAGMLSPIDFKSKSSDYADKTQNTLNELGKLLENYPEGKVTILGYAGSDLSLAETRAKAVVRYITMNFRVDPDRLLAKAGNAAQQPKNSQISFEVFK